SASPLQPPLMRQLSLRPFDKEFRIEGKSAVRIGVELDHPAVESALVELRIDCAIERVGEIDPPGVAAHFHHLRSATELAILRTGMGSARDDAADAHLAGELGIERIRYVVLLQVARAPERDIEEAFGHGEVDF